MTPVDGQRYLKFVLDESQSDMYILSTCTLPLRLKPQILAMAGEWPRYCRKVYWTKMVQNGPNDHFGQNGLIPNWILAFARPKWTILVQFGLKRPFWSI